MQIVVEGHSEHIVVVQLRGELDALTCGRVVDDVKTLAGTGPRHVVLNLCGLQFVDSTGLSAIARLSQALAEGGRNLVLSSPSAFCRSVMEKLGLDRIVPILDSDEEAGAVLTGVGP